MSVQEKIKSLKAPTEKKKKTKKKKQIILV